MATRTTIDQVGSNLRRFNDFVKCELHRQHKTQGQLSEYLSVNGNTTCNKLNGKAQWTLKEALKICNFLKVNLNEII